MHKIISKFKVCDKMNLYWFLCHKKQFTFSKMNLLFGISAENLGVSVDNVGVSCMVAVGVSGGTGSPVESDDAAFFLH